MGYGEHSTIFISYLEEEKHLEFAMLFLQEEKGVFKFFFLVPEGLRWPRFGCQM